VKRTRSDKQDVVGSNHAIASVDRRPLNDWQNVALYAFARYVRTMAAFATCNFVDFVEEDDSGIFDPINGDARDLVHIDEPLLFFLDQVLKRLVHFHLPLFGALAEDVGQHVLDVDVHLLNALVGDDFERREITLTDVNLYGTLVELAFA
jgi:hypothetical protein